MPVSKLRIVFYFLAAFLTVLMGAIAYLVFYSDKILIRYKPNIERQLSNLAGGPVTFSSMQLHLFPNFYLDAVNVIANPKVGTKDECIKLGFKEVSLKLDLFSLFKNDIKIDSIAISGFESRLAQVGDSFSFETSVDSKCDSYSKETTDTQVTTDIDNDQKSSWNLDSFQLTNSKITISKKNGSDRILEIRNFHASVEGTQAEYLLKSAIFNGALDGIELKARSKKAAVNLEKVSAILEEVQLTLADDKITLSGNFDYTNHSGEFSAVTNAFKLESLTKLMSKLQLQLPVPRAGKLTFNLSLKSKPDAIWNISGFASATNIDLGSPESYLKSIKLENINGDFQNSRFQNAEAKFSVAGFEFSDHLDHYSLEASNGSLKLGTKGAAYLISGELSVTNFGFSDDQTKIRDVRAAIKGIDGKIDPKGDASFAFKLTGDNLSLINPNVQIQNIQSVTAPLKVSVPKKGGYAVSGPVTASKVNLSTSDRKFDDITGTIEILVSSPIKRFTTKNINCSSLGQNLLLVTDFSMLPKSYALNKTRIAIGEGGIDISGDIKRDESKQFNSDIKVTNVKLAELISVALQKKDVDYSGKLSEFEATLSGNTKEPLASLNGKGRFVITDKLLRDFNLTQSLGRAISKIPVMGASMIPKEEVDEQGEKTVDGEFSMANSTIDLNKVTINRERYTVKGRAKVGFDMSVNGTASVIFLKETFHSLGFGFDKLGNLISRAGRISIPIILSGKFPDPQITADVETFVRDNSGISLVQSIGSRIGKAITSPFRSANPTREEAPEATPTQGN